MLPHHHINPRKDTEKDEARNMVPRAGTKLAIVNIMIRRHGGSTLWDELYLRHLHAPVEGLKIHQRVRQGGERPNEKPQPLAAGAQSVALCG